MSDASSRIRELHAEILESQQKRKELNKVIKEGYEQSKEYHDLVDEMNKLRARKKVIEAAIRNQYSSEFNKSEDLKLDIKDTKMVLSDLLWNELVKNKSVEVQDAENNKYVPQIVVTLKKERS
jgi:seryl-tRNA synthetase